MCMVQVSLAVLGLSTFLRVIVGTQASSDFLRSSGSLASMHSFGMLNVQRSCLLASRVRPCVSWENVGVVMMLAWGMPSR